MSTREIRIDRLQLRLSGLPANRSTGSRVAFARSVANSVAEGLGKTRPPAANRTLGELRVQLRRSEVTPGRIAQQIRIAIDHEDGGR